MPVPVLVPMPMMTPTRIKVDMLWLKRNPLMPAGGPVLGRMLRTNRMLHTLDLDNTGLLDEGAITVLRSLRFNGGVLRHLYLNGNGLGQPTATVRSFVRSLLRSLVYCSRLFVRRTFVCSFVRLCVCNDLGVWTR